MRLLAIVVSIDWHTETKLKERAKMSKNPVDSFLCVGLALVDLIVEVDGYPIEDDKCRYASNPSYCSSNSIMFILNEFLI